MGDSLKHTDLVNSLDLSFIRGLPRQRHSVLLVEHCAAVLLTIQYTSNQIKKLTKSVPFYKSLSNKHKQNYQTRISHNLNFGETRNVIVELELHFSVTFI